MPRDSFALSPRTAYGTLLFNDRRSIAQRQRQRRRHPPITHHHLEHRKRRNVLLIFADNAQPNIGWPSIVQHLASFHPAVIHHNSTASTSRHVITPALPLLRQSATYFLASDHGRATYPFVSNMSLFYSYYYSLSMHPHPTPHLHPSTPRRFRRPMNSLRPFFRLLFASTRFIVSFFPLGFGISITATLQANIINTKQYIQVIPDGVVVLMDVHEIQKSLFGFYPNNRGRTNQSTVNNI